MHIFLCSSYFSEIFTFLMKVFIQLIHLNLLQMQCILPIWHFKECYNYCTRILNFPGKKTFWLMVTCYHFGLFFLLKCIWWKFLKLVEMQVMLHIHSICMYVFVCTYVFHVQFRGIIKTFKWTKWIIQCWFPWLSESACLKFNNI